MSNGKSEFDLIAWIRRQADCLPPSLLKSIGDDAAVFDPGPSRAVVVTTDMLLEDVHFRRRWTSSCFLGRKSLAVNVSDLAAMGARPYACLLALALPPELTGDYFCGFVRGFLEEARQWNMCLAGGDLSRNSLVLVTVTAWGYVETGPPLYRSAAQEGDWIVVVGELGFSRRGLGILSQEDPDLGRIESEEALYTWAGDAFRYRCLKAHLLPTPLADVGLWLQQNGLANAMIDVSDGLVSDLSQVARESGLAAQLETERIPLPRGAEDQDRALDSALHGGEDYALLFTASHPQLARLQRSYPSTFPSCNVIGRMIEGEPAVYLIRRGESQKCEPKGFDHFRPPTNSD